jgi:hypothetical protein
MPTPKVTITLRLTPENHRAIKRRAELNGVPLATYIVECALIRMAFELGVETGLLPYETPHRQTDERVVAGVKALLTEYGEA